MSELPADEVRSRIWRRYHPEGHPHEEGDFVSASYIVSSSAERIAKDMLKDDPNDVPSYFSFTGNRLADAALADEDVHELQLNVGVPGTEYTLRGHPDGVSVVDDKVVVSEHKSHLTGTTERKKEKARRQALLYLAIMHDQRETFDSAVWEDDYSWTWEPEYQPGQVVVAVATPRPEPVVFAWPEDRCVTEDELDELLFFYLNKAQKIVEAVEENNLSIARRWDVEHDEFEDISTPEDPDEFKKSVSRIKELKEQIDELEDERKAEKRRLRRKLEEEGEEELEVGGKKAKVITQERGGKASKKDLREVVEEEIGEERLEELRGEAYESSHLRVYEGGS